MRIVRTIVLRLALVCALLLAGPIAVLVAGGVPEDDWYNASRAPTGLAPDPATTAMPVVQVYAARAFGWRGAFGVHSWIALKDRNEAQYRVYHILGWRARHGGSALSVRRDRPDREWFGNAPTLLAHLDGAEAAEALPRIEAAIAAYPYSDRYTLWPGPNSNSFTAWVARRVPALRVDLPPTAIGKDYLGPATVFGPAASNTGYQLSLFGIAGVTLAREEGLEVNIAGLTVGFDIDDPALKLPGIGRLGYAAEPRNQK